ncbi:hypothetical protein BKA67DRAFT_658761 [Truncatella angustata]|uniref:Uncharacterized protein n=1 Tax=Truncatella angustata TaxID=152316 RepID=A0A9P8ULM5_9PEZI|nr:uncharacterized protein BKA67DRAFT_658761 [Truncatella angustata]KAH6654464.1 hypothetical protein BKA67DRAFT_658761 [Truncatella angustata]
MPKRKESRNLSRSPPSTSTTMATAVARPMTPTSAVQIPVKNKHDGVHIHNHSTRHHADAQRRPSGGSQRRKDMHTPESLPPSVAALLAVTSIPPPNRRGSVRQKRMTVDSIVPRSQVSEKELSHELSLTSSFSRSPMDVLLTPPEELLDEDTVSVTSDSCFTPALSTRAESLDSLPSLGDSFGTTILSVDSPYTPKGRKFRPPRRSLEPISSPPGGEAEEHPLWVNPDINIDDLDFEALMPQVVEADNKQDTVFLPLKVAFKSNLTASLRALRSAARSLSSFTASSVPPEDLLTRSILTIDPRVPFTDERRPPVLEEEPSEAMRRYLNPTDSARIDTQTKTVPNTRSFTASIQMQTYKVQRSKSAPSTAKRAVAPPPPASPKVSAPLTFPPGPRQREIRENSDFIRIAVLEHLMRKRGKFDTSQEGHARWLLPPRKASSKPYEIGSDGVPARWVSIMQDV